jgi:hypothetical protein
MPTLNWSRRSSEEDVDWSCVALGQLQPCFGKRVPLFVPERASTADNETRQFRQAMEAKWIDLAVSTERVDLFRQNREFRLRLSPSNLCPDCRQ